MATAALPKPVLILTGAAIADEHWYGHAAKPRPVSCRLITPADPGDPRPPTSHSPLPVQNIAWKCCPRGHCGEAQSPTNGACVR